MPTEPHMDHDTGQSGWTLIESLLALALLALVTALIGTALGTTRTAMRALKSQTMESNVEPVQSYLHRTLREMRLIRFAGADSSDALIDATPQNLRFVTSYAPPGQHAGLYDVEWALSPQRPDGLFDMIETRVMLRPATTVAPTTAQTETRLLRGITGLSFSYYGPEGTTQPNWRETWPDTVRLPSLVSLSVRLQSSDARRWYPITVSVPAGQ